MTCVCESYVAGMGHTEAFIEEACHDRLSLGFRASLCYAHPQKLGSTSSNSELGFDLRSCIVPCLSSKECPFGTSIHFNRSPRTLFSAHSQHPCCVVSPDLQDSTVDRLKTRVFHVSCCVPEAFKSGLGHHCEHVPRDCSRGNPDKGDR